MKRAANKDTGFRVPYFFCLHCKARREAVDEGDAFPICVVCRKRQLELRHETVAAPPADDRPPEAAPLVQPKSNRPRRDSALALEVLTQLVTDLPGALENPETHRALFGGVFNLFVREIVNIMVIERVEWRAATNILSKEFCLQHATWLEEFMVWASEPAGTPSFITEPTTREPLPHDPLPATNPGTGSDRGAEHID